VCVRFVFEQEGKIDDIELGHARGQIAGGEITHREQYALHHREQVVRAVAEVENVPVMIDLDRIAHASGERFFKMDRRAAVG